MNPIPAFPAATIRPRFTRWTVLFLATVVLPFGAVMALILSFRVGADSRALRETVLASSPGNYQRVFAIGLGRLPVGIARAALAFVPMDPQARTAIQALRSADVSVYRHGVASDVRARSQLLGRIRDTMRARGWVPAVSVCDGQDVVGVFVPEHVRSPGRFAACVLVMDDETLVVATGRLNLEPLATIARGEIRLHAEPKIGGLLSLASLRQ